MWTEYYQYVVVSNRNARKTVPSGARYDLSIRGTARAEELKSMKKKPRTISLEIHRGVEHQIFQQITCKDLKSVLYLYV